MVTGVTFHQLAELQRLLQYEKVLLRHDDQEKDKLLKSLHSLHTDYYTIQLGMREALGKSQRKKKLIENPRALLEDDYIYVEKLVLTIRNSIEAFNAIVKHCPSNLSNLDFLVESFAFSFFEDLMNPENSEIELLKVIDRMIDLEFTRTKHITHIFNENVASVLSKMLLLYTKRRTQRKYLKLLFKKPLNKIVHSDTVDLRLDPKSIYNTLDNETFPEVQTKSKKRWTFFGLRTSKKEVPQPRVTAEYDNNYYLEDPRVQSIMEQLTDLLIEHCTSLLQALYQNVSTMPYGLRWVCKTMNDLIIERVPEISERDRHGMLGTFLITRWWIPSLVTADRNGLVQDIILSNTARNNLSLIGNIIKHTFRQEAFHEPQYYRINKFISEEIPKVEQFFRDIVAVEDIIKSGEEVCDDAPIISQKSIRNVEYKQNNDTMAYYYQAYPYKHHEQAQIHQPETQKNFHIQAVVLSLEEVEILVNIVLSNREEFAGPKLQVLPKMAQIIKNSMDNNSFVKQQYLNECNLTQQDLIYLLFLDEKLPQNMEENYSKRQEKDSKGQAGQQHILNRVKFATRNLLFSLDSFDMFFDQREETSLMQISEFIIQFSYLFESRKAAQQGKYSVRLLAQFLRTYLEIIPEEYKRDNYKKLYRDIFQDCKERCNTTREVADQNKQILLLAINSMEKHRSDVRQEERLQKSLQHTRNFLEIIKQIRVQACLFVNEDGIVYTAHQQQCPHSKTEFVGSSQLNSFKSLQSPRVGKRQSDNSKNFSGHLSTIEEFAEEFTKFAQVKESTLEEEDYGRVADAYFYYLKLVNEAVRKTPRFQFSEEKEIEAVVHEIEKYLIRSMYKEIFPIQPSDMDIQLYRKSLELDWLTPENFDIAQSNINEDMWKFSIQALCEIDEVLTPQEKLSQIVESINIITGILDLYNTSGKSIGADDMVPIIIYVVLKATPKKLYSNLNYIKKFRHQSKMLAQDGFCYQQVQTACVYIMGLTSEELRVSQEEYDQKVREARERHFL